MCKCTIFLFNIQIFFGKSYFYGEYTSIPYSTTRPTLGTVSNHGWALYISSSFNFIILWVRIILIDSSRKEITLDAIWIADTNLNMILFPESCIRIKLLSFPKLLLLQNRMDGHWPFYSTPMPFVQQNNLIF